MKISKENGLVSKQVEDSRHQQQTKRSSKQLEDAEAKFSSKLKEPGSEEMQSKTRPDRRKGDNPFDKPFDSAGAGHGDAVIANPDTLQAEAPAVAKATQESPAAHDINSVAQQIATRVLVSPPGASNPEVRIQLKESFLQGSDVRIFREGGALKVVFVASNQEAANFIASNRDSMVTALSNRLPGEQVDISVETRQSEQARGEHGEGRSRQQYVADDDADSPAMKR